MRDLRVEWLLEEEGVKYDFVQNHDIGKVRFDAKVRAQIRIKGTDDRKVKEFAAAMKESGTRSFPAIVVAKNGDGISGGHRHAGALASGHSGFDTYICDTMDPDVIRKLRILFNTREGDREPREDRLQHAFHLVDGGGNTLAEAARIVGLPQGTVERYVRRERFVVSMAKAGVPNATLTRLPAHAVDAIHAVPRSALQKKLCVVADRYRMAGDDMVALGRDVRNAPSDLAALQVIDEFESRASASTSGGKRKAPPSPTAKIEAAIRRLENALKGLDKDRLTEDGAIALAMRLYDHAALVKSAAEGL